MPQSSAALTDPSTHRTRAAGIAIAAATIVSTVVVAMDRSGGGHGPLQVLQGIAELTTLKEVVHGVAIASVSAYAFGYAVLARRLGLQRPEVLAGLLVYLLGCVAMVGATIIDGFVIPHVAGDAITASPERLAFAYNLVHYLGIVLNDLAKLGWVLQSVATLFWSVRLMHRRGLPRAAGATGLVSSALVVALIAASPTNLTMTALLSVLVAQLLWNLAAGGLLIRGIDDVAHEDCAPRAALAS